MSYIAKEHRRLFYFHTPVFYRNGLNFYTRLAVRKTDAG